MLRRIVLSGLALMSLNCATLPPRDICDYNFDTTSELREEAHTTELILCYLKKIDDPNFDYASCNSKAWRDLREGMKRDHSFYSRCNRYIQRMYQE